MDNSLERFKNFYSTATLWSGTLLGLDQFHFSSLKFDHLKGIDHIELPVIPPRTVLGKRAEYFFQFCIEQSSNYKLLVSNQQVFKGKITIGELDYIVQEQRSKQIIHVELVYKFYIYDMDKVINDKDPIRQELSKYQGPNGKDNLVRKIDHLKNHQLPLLYNEHTQDILDQYDLDVHKIRQEVCFIAHVFIPQQLWNHTFKHINKASIVGYYFRHSAFAKAETSNIYFLPKKYEWKMKPQELEESFTFLQILELTTASLSRGFAPLIWMQLEDNTFERFFVIK
ncbi:DUF1853 family protein [Nonlabens sp.]|uniref:DUF1853 family protein n=1 Tax=Nonlabens sp. TaxID=1888209 RepID=UPI003263C3EB